MSVKRKQSQSDVPVRGKSGTPPLRKFHVAVTSPIGKVAVAVGKSSPGTETGSE
jgi:hypothetical protein